MSRPAVFLDRDGTIIAEREYLSDPAGVELLPGTVEALRRLREAGYALVVITNQSGIARGLYGTGAFLAVQARLEELLAARHVHFAGVYFCPHHPDFTGPCACRKPGTELFRRAIRDLDLDAGRSWYVGDRLGDVLPAKELGGRGILVRTGHGGELAAEHAGFPVVADLRAAGRRILDSGKG